MPRRGRPPGLKEYKSYQRLENQQCLNEDNFCGVESEVTEIEETDVSRNQAITKDLYQIAKINHVSTRSGNKYIYEIEDSSNSDDSESDSDALQPIEESLVKVALARADLARQKGKKNVKLKKDEMIALEKRRRILQRASKSKQRAGIYDSLTVPLSSSMLSDQMEPASPSKLPRSKAEMEKTEPSPPVPERSPSHSDSNSRKKSSKSSHLPPNQVSEKTFSVSSDKPKSTPAQHSYALRSLSSHSSNSTDLNGSSATDSYQKAVSPLDPFQYLVDTDTDNTTSLD